MIHVRQHLVNPYGQKLEKIKTIQGELGSSLRDNNDKEIFVGDIVEIDVGDIFPESFIKTGEVKFGVNGFYVETLDNVYGLAQFEHIQIVGQKTRL